MGIVEGQRHRMGGMDFILQFSTLFRTAPILTRIVIHGQSLDHEFQERISPAVNG